MTLLRQKIFFVCGNFLYTFEGSTERERDLELEIVSIKNTVGGHSPLKSLTV